jgi:hypothetical protein
MELSKNPSSPSSNEMFAERGPMGKASVEPIRATAFPGKT